MKEWYKIPGRDVEQAFELSDQGLTDAQIEERLAQYGPNRIEEGKKKGVLQIFFRQFCDLLVIILIIAALISMASGNVESTIVIIAVITLNAVLGTAQHVKAQKSLESLKALSSPNAKVIRGGRKVEVSSECVVPGDRMILEAGDLVVADGRILHNYSLRVNESSLTGESANVEKSDADIVGEASLGDRTNMVYSGSLVTYGRAEVVVTGTGMETELGKIAGLMNATKERKTPLQVSLDVFSGRLAVIILVISAVVFGIHIYRGQPVMESLMFAVALAVAAIPEALGSIVTIVQAMGTQKMARENAIIKELKAVESLGCVSVICSDKTGTLTQNKMTVQTLYVDGRTLSPGEADLKHPAHRYLLYNAVLNNDAVLADEKEIGDPTECALLAMARDSGLEDGLLRNALPRLEEIPFDSERKLMSTKYCIDGASVILTKGALDVLLNRTAFLCTQDGVREITEEDKETIQRKNMEFSREGLRVLAFAYREWSKPLTKAAEDDLVFLGLVSMEDPPRKESAAAVSDAWRAGIRPVMITGDHKATATAIAKKIGIFREGDLAVVGTELDEMTGQQLEETIERISVYARVSPENKIQIVEAWQKKGYVVAMTGDGVNDAPALKKADIGVAMGITGTEVSKDAAAMILSDDNFATIIKAVANGRNVYKNIKNAILFLLSGNMAAIFAVLYTSVMALPMPFQAVQLLFINLVTDSLPALAIGMEPADKDLLSERPRDPKAGILSGSFVSKILLQGALIAVCTMGAFYAGLQTSAAVASTMAFAALTFARLFHGFNCRGKHSVFRMGFRKNWYSLGAFLLGTLLLALVLIVPAIQPWFTVTSLTGVQLAQVAVFAAAPTAIIQIVKLIADAART